jgi:hypothetical protein
MRADRVGVRFGRGVGAVTVLDAVWRWRDKAIGILLISHARTLPAHRCDDVLEISNLFGTS